MIAFFASMMGKSTLDPYYGMPAGLRSAVAFRFNAKDEQNFALRNDAGIDYVVSYTDPISGIMVGQPIASEQPVKLSGSTEFDGISDALIVLNSGLKPFESWAIATFNTSPAPDYNAIFTIRDNGSAMQASIQFEPFTNRIRQTDNVHDSAMVNNLSTDIFLPALSKKSVSIRHNNIDLPQENLFIGRDASYGGRFWNGKIYDIILFNRVLNSTERTQLQNYLETFHNFTS